MSHIQVFDPALCCSTGVCGTDVAQSLVTFAADVEWARQHGAAIDRVNLAQDPTAFATNPAILRLLERSGQKVLPVVLVDGEVAMAGRYPERAELAQWAGLQTARTIPVATSCCSGPDCC
jgi:Arsenical resistance operon protein ArsD